MTENEKKLLKANALVLRQATAAASTVKMTVLPVNAATANAVQIAITDAAQQGAGVIIVAADAFFSGQGPQIATSARQHQLRQSVSIAIMLSPVA